MLLLYVLSIIALCTAQVTDIAKLETINGQKVRNQQEGVEALMRQVGEMGMLLENYRRVILNGITEASDLCGFIAALSDVEGMDEKIPDDRSINDGMGIRLYRTFFSKLDDTILKSQLFTTLENHVDNCFAGSPNQLVAKRDKGQVQKIRFHSWGGKRSRGAPKVVIRTPFHSWGGKRSGKDV